MLQVGDQNQNAVGVPDNSAASSSPPPTSGLVKRRISGASSGAAELESAETVIGVSPPEDGFAEDGVAVESDAPHAEATSPTVARATSARTLRFDVMGRRVPMAPRRCRVERHRFGRVHRP